MIQSTPVLLRVDARALTVLERVLAAAAPQEGCALLLGEPAAVPLCDATQSSDATQPSGCTAAPLRLHRIWPCLNVWTPVAEREQRFAIDPREQLLAQKWGRQRGLQVIGAAHSHPRSAPVPSATDRQLCLAPTLMAIRGQEPAGPRLAFWWLEETGRPRQLAWTMED